MCPARSTGHTSPLRYATASTASFSLGMPSASSPSFSESIVMPYHLSFFMPTSQ